MITLVKVSYNVYERVNFLLVRIRFFTKYSCFNLFIHVFEITSDDTSLQWFSYTR
ncbi:hypothetical protein Hanom_Chr13g01231151 [Helianthus anomalus]